MRMHLRNRRSNKGPSLFGLQTLIVLASFTATQRGQIKIDRIRSVCGTSNLFSRHLSVKGQQN